MAFSMFWFPNFRQSKTSNKSYAIGTFEATAGQWLRITLSYNAMPLSRGLGAPGTYYDARVVAPNGAATVLGNGTLTGESVWFPGGVQGVFQAAADGIYTLRYNTYPKQDLSGMCWYENIVAAVESFEPAQAVVDPVAVFTLPDTRVGLPNNNHPFVLGSFSAVPNQQYKLTCYFDASGMLTTLWYSLAGSGFSGMPDGCWFSSYSWSKCCVTGVVTALDSTCELDFVTNVSSVGYFNISNFMAFVEAFVPAIIP